MEYEFNSILLTPILRINFRVKFSNVIWKHYIQSEIFDQQEYAYRIAKFFIRKFGYESVILRGYFGFDYIRGVCDAMIDSDIKRKNRKHFAKYSAKIIDEPHLYTDIFLDPKWTFISLVRYIFGKFGRECCDCCIGSKKYCPWFLKYLCPAKLEFLEKVAKSSVNKIRFINYLILSNPRYVQHFAQCCGLTENLHEIFNAARISEYNRDRLYICIFRNKRGKKY